jgi:hypothetical protein
VTERGKCSGKKALTCDTVSHTLKTDDCGARNKTCVMDQARGASCVEGPSSPTTTNPSSPSGMPSGPVTGGGACAAGLDFKGMCQNGVAIWCGDDNVTQTYDCNQAGLTCQSDACEPGAYCCDKGAMSTQPNGSTSTNPATKPSTPTTTGCNGLTFAGECDGAVMRYCSGDQIVTSDCSTYGQTCSMTVGGARCETAGTTGPQDPCMMAGVTDNGTCVGTVRTYCDHHWFGIGSPWVAMVDCAATNQICSTGSAGEAVCIDPPQAANPMCSQIGTNGTCNGNTLVQCDAQGHVMTTDCSNLAGVPGTCVTGTPAQCFTNAI